MQVFKKFTPDYRAKGILGIGDAIGDFNDHVTQFSQDCLRYAKHFPFGREEREVHREITSLRSNFFLSKCIPFWEIIMTELICLTSLCRREESRKFGVFLHEAETWNTRKSVEVIPPEQVWIKTTSWTYRFIFASNRFFSSISSFRFPLFTNFQFLKEKMSVIFLAV